jgi:hypothetical protein
LATAFEKELEMKSTPTVRHQLYIPEHLSKRLRALAAEPGAAKSKIVSAALASWLDRVAVNEVEEQIGNRLNRALAAVGRVERNQNYEIEMLGGFIRFFMTLNPPAADPAARAAGAAQFDRFIAQVAAGVGSGARLFSPLTLNEGASS